jgi:acyl dehydratase
MTNAEDLPQRYAEDVEVGAALPTVEDEITYRRVIMNPATTWDYFPGHHDPAYARAQGQPTIYVNTMHVLGFIDRMVSEWAGPRSFLVRRKVSTHLSIYAGDTMVGNGHVVATRHEERDGRVRHLIDLELSVANQHGVRCASALVTVALPARHGEQPRVLWWQPGEVA